MARVWTDAEKALLKRKYLTHTPKELVWALTAEGFSRTRRAVREKMLEMGLSKNCDVMPFSLQITLFCETGDSFLLKVEKDKRRNGTPYIVARNNSGQEAIFGEAIDGKRGEQPDECRWVRWYNHPSKGTWPY